MIIGTLGLRTLERIYIEAHINEPFVFSYTEPGNHAISGLVTGYFDTREQFGRVCVFENVIITKDAIDREAVKNDMAVFAMRAAFAAPVDAILTAVNLKHPLHDMLVEWTTKGLGGQWYADVNDESWFYITREVFQP